MAAAMYCHRYEAAEQIGCSRLKKKPLAGQPRLLAETLDQLAANHEHGTLG